MTGRAQLGRDGERAAVGILEREGYRILRTNYATRFGEIDIVAHDTDQLCFVEVRLRSGDLFGTALESLTRRKRNHLRKAALLYLVETGERSPDYRFDFLALEWDRARGACRSHVLLRNAFGADD